MVKYTEPPTSDEDLPEPFDNTPLPNGKYIARIAEIVERQSKSTGDTYWNVKAEVIAPEEFSNRVAFGGIFFGDNEVVTAKRRRALRALGYVEPGKPGADYDLLPSEGEGKVVEIDVRQETYKDKTSSKIQEILPVPEGATVPNDGIPF